MSNPDHREFLKNSMALALVPAAESARIAPGLSGESELGPQPRAEFFKGFKREEIRAAGAVINTVYGGDEKGSPLPLLHGIPEMRVLWRKLAPALAQDYFLVLSDLRGY